MKKIIKSINFEIISKMFIILIGLVIFLSNIIFLLGGTISKFVFPASFCLSAFIVYLLYNKKVKLKDIIINIGFSVIIFFILLFISMLFFDNSWDGNVYHKEMIGLMKNGMNPIYNVLSGDIWTQHYANGTEVFSSVLYAFTNNIESGKVVNLLLSFSLFYYAYTFFKSCLKNKAFLIILSISISLNPLLLNQFHTYYIDAVVANSLYLFILSLLFFIKNNSKFDLKIGTLFLFSSIVVINSKFTALLIWGLFLLVIGGYILIMNIRKKDFKNVKKIIILALVTSIISVAICGSSTYVKNFIDHGHPFYPLMGEQAVDIETGNEPESFKNKSHTKKWLYATFSKTYTWYNKSPELKIPFSIYESELESIKYPDIRIGGLGVWFSGILVLSVIGILSAGYFVFKKSLKSFIVSLLLICAIFLPIPKLPIVWQARYYPQIYLVSFIAIFMLLLANKKAFKYFAYLIIVCTFINSILLLPQAKEQYDSSRIINNQLVELSRLSLTENIVISQDNYTFYGTYYNYIDYNIKYKYSKQKLENAIPLYHGAFYKIIEE